MTNTIQDLIDKQLQLVIALQLQNDPESLTKDSISALTSAISGLRDLDAISRRQQAKVVIAQDVRDYIVNRAAIDSRAAQLLKQLIEAGLETEARS